MKRQPLFLLILPFLLSACAYSVHQVQVSDYRPYKPLSAGQIVKAETKQFVILGFTKQTDYVDEAFKELLGKCPGGTISGITTQISTDLGFFSWTNRALMQGLCVSVAAAK